MALHRGIQSAIFYYLSCAPCSDARYRKRRKREAQRDRLEKAELEAHMPNLYRHPSPSSTNPHWQAEIALGPMPTSRGGKRKATPTSDSQHGNGDLRPSAPESRDGSQGASRTNMARLWTSDERNDSKYSFGQHQRRDDELWGSTATDLPLRSFLDGPSTTRGLTRPPKARVKDPSSYQSIRNPSVNDLHPATVTKVTSKEDIAWMLQPPPIADVMSGKAGASGSRSNSTRSRPSVNSTPLSRQPSERLKEDRLASRAMSVPESAVPQGQGHDRSNAARTTDERDFAISPSKREKRRPSPIKIGSASEDSEVTVIHRPSIVPEHIRSQQSRRAASRPQLSTILSDSIMPADDGVDPFAPSLRPKAENSLPSARNSEASSGERDKTARRSAVLVNDSSLKILRDVAPKASLFNTRIFTASPGVEPRLRSPAMDGEEENRLTGGPELFDTPDFELGEWVHEHTKRPGVKHRWSMDI